MRRLRGSPVTLNAREEAYTRSLEQAGDHICVPWTGIDVAGKFVCPGFEYKPDRGLMAYIVPLEIVNEAGLVPGFAGTPISTISRNKGSIVSASAGPVAVGANLPKDTLESEYFRLLKMYLRMVKISLAETDRKVFPYPDEYYVVVHGPYHKSMIGHLITKPDPTGARFAVPNGVSFVQARAQVETSRLKTPVTESSTPNLPVSSSPSKPLPAPAPAPAAAAARVTAAVSSMQSGNAAVPVVGVPKPGSAHESGVKCTADT